MWNIIGRLVICIWFISYWAIGFCGGFLIMLPFSYIITGTVCDPDDMIFKFPFKCKDYIEEFFVKLSNLFSYKSNYEFWK